MAAVQRPQLSDLSASGVSTTLPGAVISKILRNSRRRKLVPQTLRVETRKVARSCGALLVRNMDTMDNKKSAIDAESRTQRAIVGQRPYVALLKVHMEKVNAFGAAMRRKPGRYSVAHDHICQRDGQAWRIVAVGCDSADELLAVMLRWHHEPSAAPQPATSRRPKNDLR